MSPLSVYLHFDGNCREAMNFYKDAIGGELMVQTVGESPMKDQFPDTPDQVLHAVLTKEHYMIMASDMLGKNSLVHGNNIALSVNCSSEDEINNLYTKLSEGGEIIEALKTQFWGAIFGMFTDKFGIRWMFNFDKEPQPEA